MLAKKWTDEAKDGRWKRPYTDLTYPEELPT